MADMPIAEVVRRFRAARDYYEKCRLAAEKAKAEYDAMRFRLVVDAFEKEGVSNMSVSHIGTVYLTDDVRASIPAVNKMAAWQWLRDNGYEHLIVETINAGTLKSWAKERLVENDELPEDLFNIQPYTYAKIKKA